MPDTTSSSRRSSRSIPVPAKGARVTFESGKPRVIDGPDIDSREVIGGYWIFEIGSREEAKFGTGRRSMLQI